MKKKIFWTMLLALVANGLVGSQVRADETAVEARPTSSDAAPAMVPHPVEGSSDGAITTEDSATEDAAISASGESATPEAPTDAAAPTSPKKKAKRIRKSKKARREEKNKKALEKRVKVCDPELVKFKQEQDALSTQTTQAAPPAVVAPQAVVVVEETSKGEEFSDAQSSSEADPS